MLGPSEAMLLMANTRRILLAEDNARNAALELRALVQTMLSLKSSGSHSSIFFFSRANLRPHQNRHEWKILIV